MAALAESGLISRMRTNVAEHLRLMLVTDDRILELDDPLAPIVSAVRGGVTSVQLRLKTAAPAEIVTLARRLVSTLDVPVLINDRPDIALAAGAAGVHLGPEDLSPSLARKVLGSKAMIGASVGNEGESLLAAGADYWGIGPWRSTGTKLDAGAPLGAEGFARLAKLAGGTPVVAIGGITAADVAAVRAAGGVGVAVVSAILGAPDPAAAAREFLSR